MSSRSKLKVRLYDEQDGRCFYCSTDLDPPAWNCWRPNMPTLDHVIPISRGGRYGPKVLACYACNQAKGKTSAQDFITRLAGSSDSAGKKHKEALARLDRLMQNRALFGRGR